MHRQHDRRLLAGAELPHRGKDCSLFQLHVRLELVRKLANDFAEVHAESGVLLRGPTQRLARGDELGNKRGMRSVIVVDALDDLRVGDPWRDVDILVCHVKRERFREVATDLARGLGDFLAGCLGRPRELASHDQKPPDAAVTLVQKIHEVRGFAPLADLDEHGHREMHAAGRHAHCNVGGHD